VSEARLIPSERCDVVVIGGGPAGSAAALLLARAGVQVIQLERRHFDAPGCDRWRSGEGLPPASQRELAALDVDLDGSGAITNHVRRLMTRWPGGRVTHDAFPAGHSINMIQRESFDAALFGAARHAGADSREGWQVRELRRDDGGVCGVRARDDHGRATHIDARLVIDAGGRNARSLTQLGLRRSVGGPTFLVVALILADVAGIEPDRWEMHLFGDPLQVLQITPLAPGITGCGLGAPLRSRPKGQSRESFFWEQVSQDHRLMARLAGGRQLQPPWTRANLAYRVAPLALAGLMLVGDASGYTSPLLGDGIWSALRSATIAADVAIDALSHGDTSQQRLMQYQRRWAAARRTRVLINRIMVRGVEYPRALEAAASRGVARRLMLRGLLA
jgi:menaquinone-9 beta-reductase